jgi:hypothetical protein
MSDLNRDADYIITGHGTLDTAINAMRLGEGFLLTFTPEELRVVAEPSKRRG